MLHYDVRTGKLENKADRGPEIYQSGEYTYRCKVAGDFTWFQGYEEIFQGNQKVYECVFHGGLLK